MSEEDLLEPTEIGPSVDVPEGTLVGDYRIERKIGEGGMGVVFAATHPLIGKRAAIKVLQRCEDPNTASRFLDEARIVNTIGHPNIVDIFAFGQLPDGRSYLVMEWLDGETLRARLDRSRPALAETAHVLRALALALEAAHDKGVVHRDLKPDNIFLVPMRNQPPRVKLLDFGVAKMLRGERIDRTASHQVIGTPLYIAPEQARAEAIDHRADIYALGALAFELVVGRPPFFGASAMEVIAKHMMTPPVRPSSVVPGIPPELDDAIFAMLAKDPAARPTLAALGGVLDRVEKDVKPPAVPVTIAPPVIAAKAPRSRAFWIGVALLATLAMIAGIAIAITSSKPQKRKVTPEEILDPSDAGL